MCDGFPCYQGEESVSFVRSLKRRRSITMVRSVTRRDLRGSFLTTPFQFQTFHIVPKTALFGYLGYPRTQAITIRLSLLPLHVYFPHRQLRLICTQCVCFMWFQPFAFSMTYPACYPTTTRGLSSILILRA